VTFAVRILRFRTIQPRLKTKVLLLTSKSTIISNFLCSWTQFATNFSWLHTRERENECKASLLVAYLRVPAACHTSLLPVDPPHALLSSGETHVLHSTRHFRNEPHTKLSTKSIRRFVCAWQEAFLYLGGGAFGAPFGQMAYGQSYGMCPRSRHR
jgi:hypothetical protein